MAFTRFKYDECRTKKELQQSTDPGRWIMNVPGNGSDPCYIEDPQIIIQKWGANLRTNAINLESDLLGMNQNLGRDCLVKQNITKSEAIKYPSCRQLYTEQSRAIAPAWMVRDAEQNNFEFLPINPQENVCLPFLNNTNTRLVAKDYFDRWKCPPTLGA
jgi:hypothetical protein